MMPDVGGTWGSRFCGARFAGRLALVRVGSDLFGSSVCFSRLGLELINGSPPGRLINYSRFGGRSVWLWMALRGFEWQLGPLLCGVGGRVGGDWES